ncbi:MAG: hypothetical protein ACLSBA_00610 [Adlercreutzia equolifaciens]|uniref:Uncharacterized protein n=1 Tax=Adlercreutzia equolifaciens subsp. celatus DSM 18785 TaxID=1121021 RepID=A0A3N0AZ52_9ACTN|nr:hypothetical protein [Adlercreutzia equolifaciens]MCP2078803.1 hypothetical protein [Adlercreutzia equolifaciens subsp. celatus DSM 18785]RFT91460.1 hypothetical protein DX904_09655 [Adlercreutzia equolifaciens subsp. celatus]RNL39616.1 hypothetical protein DMP10_01395 [Adlercreutzia equolifaciens subsp. celatus DSM 18785]BCS56564.1 hypothetical protein ADLECEL_04490 [Adlercreutzia equolifaciens subsp. celatus]
MKTKPIGIRFDQGEYDLISDYARREGETFSEVVRKGAICYVSPDHFKGYRSLAQLASSAKVDDMELLFGQFLDDFVHAHDKRSLIEEEPEWKGDPGRWRYDFAAAAHKLSHDNDVAVPRWVLKDEYVAETPYYAFGTTNPEFQAYLRETTPREYQWHNLFLGENVLSRA